ncbi:hypothetical protein AB205_0188130 [Aquarana catesbeiana]|uniref:Uncharacterized protein n=1 Tax=Aquarana catesbeiana TaxID=8400 RepID=A0A2G9QDG3_AQUCT|nr:hypothetical protein AB205_0188130 [Aquarana catesbeiana]PIO13653.1 hypothetical protein AB205_0188130 [Aquarana catesbeiana]
MEFLKKERTNYSLPLQTPLDAPLEPSTRLNP